MALFSIYGSLQQSLSQSLESGNASAGVDHEVDHRTDTDAEGGADLVTDRAIDIVETATAAEDSRSTLNLSFKLHFDFHIVFDDLFFVWSSALLLVQTCFLICVFVKTKWKRQLVKNLFSCLDSVFTQNAKRRRTCCWFVHPPKMHCFKQTHRSQGSLLIMWEEARWNSRNLLRTFSGLKF